MDRIAASVGPVQSSNSVLTALDHRPLPPAPTDAQVTTATVELPPGDAATARWSRFVVVMIHAPGAPMRTLVDDAELTARRPVRAARPEVA
jgi:hypothetical protein